MAVGVNASIEGGRQGAVQVYEAETFDSKEWTNAGILYHSDSLDEMFEWWVVEALGRRVGVVDME